MRCELDDSASIHWCFNLPFTLSSFRSCRQIQGDFRDLNRTPSPMLQMSIASLKGDRVPEGSAESGMEGRKVLHTCDPECDPQGCYGKGPTQCVHCLHYKLDK